MEMHPRSPSSGGGTMLSLSAISLWRQGEEAEAAVLFCMVREERSVMKRMDGGGFLHLD